MSNGGDDDMLARIHLLRGVLKAQRRPHAGTRVGVVGGSAGVEDFARKLKSHGFVPSFLVCDTECVHRLARLDLKVWIEEEKLSFLARPMDLLVVLEDRGVLSAVAIDTIRANASFSLVVDFANDSPMTSDEPAVHTRAGKTWFSPGCLEEARRIGDEGEEESWTQRLESWAGAQVSMGKSRDSRF